MARRASLQDAPSLEQTGTRAVRRRLGQDLDPPAPDVDGQQAEPEQAAEPMRPAITVSAPTGRRNRQPDLVGRPGAVERGADPEGDGFRPSVGLCNTGACPCTHDRSNSYARFNVARRSERPNFQLSERNKWPTSIDATFRSPLERVRASRSSTGRPSRSARPYSPHTHDIRSAATWAARTRSDHWERPDRKAPEDSRTA